MVSLILSCVWALLTTVPFLAVTSRRLHDSGRSFWWAGAWYAGIAILMTTGFLVSRLRPPPAQSYIPGVLFGLFLLAWFGLFIRLVYLLCARGEARANNYGDSAPTSPT
jgi:uncharacterized membrane protein YhaH (DUF805 family)